MMFAIGFVSVFVTGGLSGPILAQPALDMYLHDTYFVVAHFHLIMGVAAVMGIFAGTYFWFPKMFGSKMNASLGYAHFWFTFIGAYAVFLPMHFLGMAGHPRRYSQLTDVHYLQALLPLQRFISIAAFITIAGQLIFLFNLFWSLWRGKTAETNPWQSTTCEWSTLEGPIAIVRGPYEFNVPGAQAEFLMQCEGPEAS
jgi:cytochrome c oxidase subunit I